MRVIIQEEALRRSEGHHYHHFIQELPTIDAEPVRHGQWVHFKQHDLNAVFCSVCDYTFARLYPANYCPNCGAKMEVVR